MVGGVLLLCTVLYLTDSFVVGSSHKKYEDYFFYSKYNGSEVTWMMMPDDNGLVVSAVIAGLTPNQVLSADQVEFLLWTRENRYNPEIDYFRDEDQLIFQSYDPNKKTIVLIHGLTDTIKDPEFFLTMSEAFLDNGDYNVVGVNWVKLSNIPWYGQSVSNSYYVGTLTAKAIASLRKLAKYGAKEFHIVAYNVGTLVAGVAGSTIKGKKIEKIIGLDPPYILTDSLSLNEKLDPSDAEVVEIVHTSGNYIGINSPAGHRDFYPNGGKWPQPGCIYDIADRCSPRRSIQYYAEALIQRGGAVGVKCPNFIDFRDGKCYGQQTLSLWNDEPSRVTGKFYFFTNSEAPFWPLDPN